MTLTITGNGPTDEIRVPQGESILTLEYGTGASGTLAIQVKTREKWITLETKTEDDVEVIQGPAQLRVDASGVSGTIKVSITR